MLRLQGHLPQEESSTVGTDADAAGGSADSGQEDGLAGRMPVPLALREPQGHGAVVLNSFPGAMFKETGLAL